MREGASVTIDDPASDECCRSVSHKGVAAIPPNFSEDVADEQSSLDIFRPRPRRIWRRIPVSPRNLALLLYDVCGISAIAATLCGEPRRRRPAAVRGSTASRRPPSTLCARRRHRRAHAAFRCRARSPVPPVRGRICPSPLALAGDRASPRSSRRAPSFPSAARRGHLLVLRRALASWDGSLQARLVSLGVAWALTSLRRADDD